jgi:arylformamidase
MIAIDLTLPVVHGMPVYPDDPPVILRPLHHLESHGWRLQYLCMGSHAGTHVNVPAHMLEHGASISELPPERFMGPARRVKSPGRLPRGVGLILCGKAVELAAPALVAADPAFVGYPAGFDLPVALERDLLAADIPVYENLANLELLPPRTPFLFIGLPLALQDGDGSPVRAVAMVE